MLFLTLIQLKKHSIMIFICYPDSLLRTDKRHPTLSFRVQFCSSYYLLHDKLSQNFVASNSHHFIITCGSGISVRLHWAILLNLINLPWNSGPQLEEGLVSQPTWLCKASLTWKLRRVDHLTWQLAATRASVQKNQLKAE